MKSFKTLAFIDLETNGLLGLDPSQTKITQLSISACSVDHILELKDFNEIPRVRHNLSICCNPRKLIKNDCSEVTGLTNELLEHEKKFDQNAVDLLNSFLNHLQQPICLVAHNGKRFDYPLLRNHCQLLNKSLPDSILCCDSLDIFRKIENIREQTPVCFINGWTTKEKIQAHELLMIDEEILAVHDVLKDYSSDEDDILETKTVSQLESEILTDNEDISIIAYLDEKKELDDIQIVQKRIETTPNKPVKSQQHAAFKSKNLGCTMRPANAPRRQLFTNTEIGNTKKGKKSYPKGYFTLSGIYKRIFGVEPSNTHDSEGDVQALLKCVCAFKREFIDLAMLTASKF